MIVITMIVMIRMRLNKSNRQKVAAMKLDWGEAASPWQQMDFLGWKRCVSHLS